MSTFLFQGRYTAAAIATIIKKPEDRTGVVRTLFESCGGTLDGFWLALGSHDFVGIGQLPDSKSAVAFSMAVAAGGGVQEFKTTELLTWAEGIEAFEKAGAAKYRPPTSPAK